jgi:hypothetical protein
MEKVHIGQMEAMQVAASNTPLLAAAAFVSPIFSVRGFSNISGFAFSDVGSAVTGLRIQQAADMADFATISPFALTAGTSTKYTIVGGDLFTNAFTVEVVAPFARLVYTNGAAPQTTFRLWAAARLTSW